MTLRFDRCTRTIPARHPGPAAAMAYMWEAKGIEGEGHYGNLATDINGHGLYQFNWDFAPAPSRMWAKLAPARWQDPQKLLGLELMERAKRNGYSKSPSLRARELISPKEFKISPQATPELATLQLMAGVQKHLPAWGPIMGWDREKTVFHDEVTGECHRRQLLTLIEPHPPQGVLPPELQERKISLPVSNQAEVTFNVQDRRTATGRLCLIT